MVHYEYVGRLSEQTLLCISVVEADAQGMWNVQAQLLIVASDKVRAGRIELACAAYTDPLEAVDEAVALSRALQYAADDRRSPAQAQGAQRVRRPLG